MPAILRQLHYNGAHNKQLAHHQRSWKACSTCRLHKSLECHRKVLYRGTLPAQVLYIGEAPAVQEDATGLPFVGRSGAVLEALHEEAANRLGVPVAAAVANVVACRPPNDRKPEFDEVDACLERLWTFVNDFAQPRVLVMLGKTAQHACSNWKHEMSKVLWEAGIVQFNMPHPAYILRCGGVRKCREYEVAVDTLAGVFKEAMQETYYG